MKLILLLTAAIFGIQTFSSAANLDHDDNHNLKQVEASLPVFFGRS